LPVPGCGPARDRLPTEEPALHHPAVIAFETEGAHGTPQFQVLGALDHPFRDVPRNLGLIAGSGCAVHLGTRLIIQRKQIETHAGGDRRLGVLPRNLDESLAKSPPSLVVDPSEDRREDKALPRLQNDVPGLPLSLDVGQQFDEIADAPSALAVKVIPPVVPLEVIQLTLARGLDPPAGDNFSRYDALRVRRGISDVIASGI